MALISYMGRDYLVPVDPAELNKLSENIGPASEVEKEGKLLSTVQDKLDFLVQHTSDNLLYGSPMINVLCTDSSYILIDASNCNRIGVCVYYSRRIGSSQIGDYTITGYNTYEDMSRDLNGVKIRGGIRQDSKYSEDILPYKYFKISSLKGSQIRATVMFDSFPKEIQMSSGVIGDASMWSLCVNSRHANPLYLEWNSSEFAHVYQCAVSGQAWESSGYEINDVLKAISGTEVATLKLFQKSYLFKNGNDVNSGEWLCVYHTTTIGTTIGLTVRQVEV